MAGFKNKNRLIAVVACLWGFVSPIQARQITDMSGRIVIIPDKLSRVVPYDNKTNVILYPVAGSMMIVKARAQENYNLKYVAGDLLNKPEIDTRNAEEVLKLKPDIIVVGAFIDDREDISNYLRFSEMIKIPMVIVSLDLLSLDKTFEFLGQLLGKQAEGKECADYIRSVYKDVNVLKQGKKVGGTAYFSNDENGLRTAPRGSKHAQLFDVMNITNAAYAPLDAKGFSIVSMEQMMVANPDYIFCIGKAGTSPYRTVMKSPLWKNIAGVRNKRVYNVPGEPYLWIDMPPSVNRILGMIWFSEIFYQQPYGTTKSKVRDFYRIFYHYILSDKDYDALFRWQ